MLKPDPGQVATAGNFAIPLTPHEQPAGPVFRFSVYHLMPLPDPADWPVEILQVGVKDRCAVNPDYAPKPPKVIAKPVKAKANGAVKALTGKYHHALWSLKQR